MPRSKVVVDVPRVIPVSARAWKLFGADFVSILSETIKTVAIGQTSETGGGVSGCFLA